MQCKTGSEHIKSLRDGRASLQQAYADLRDGEAWLVGAHISVYEQGNLANHDPDRDRKLLLHKKCSGRENFQEVRHFLLIPASSRDY